VNQFLFYYYFAKADNYNKKWTGGRIDQAHHDGRAKLSLEEALQFDLAIYAALNLTKRDETLIVVTADHSHTMTINGYPARGSPLLGKNNIKYDLNLLTQQNK
jgi:alkaline phosphatase